MGAFDSEVDIILIKKAKLKPSSYMTLFTHRIPKVTLALLWKNKPTNANTGSIVHKLAQNIPSGLGSSYLLVCFVLGTLTSALAPNFPECYCQSVVKFTGVIFYSNCHYRPSQRIVSPPVGYSSENSTNKGWKFHRGKNSFVMSVDNPFPRLSPLPKEYHATFVCQHEPWAKSHLKTTRQA